MRLVLFSKNLLSSEMVESNSTHAPSPAFFFFLEITLLAVFKYSIINYGHHDIHYITVICLFFNSKFVPKSLYLCFCYNFIKFMKKYTDSTVS